MQSSPAGQPLLSFSPSPRWAEGVPHHFQNYFFPADMPVAEPALWSMWRDVCTPRLACHGRACTLKQPLSALLIRTFFQEIGIQHSDQLHDVHNAGRPLCTWMLTQLTWG